MIPSEIRKKAREALEGNWGTAATITFAYFVIMFLVSFAMNAFKDNVMIYSLIYMLDVIITVPLSLGLSIIFLKLKRGEEVTSFGFLTEGLSRFTTAWGIWLHIFIKLLLPFVCIILVGALTLFLTFLGVNNLCLSILIAILYIATIVYCMSRALLYILPYYIAYDNSELSAKDCVKRSEELMVGNRGNYLLLMLSFIGWMILACLSLGIGYFWIAPYMAVAGVCFYDEIIGKKSKSVEGTAEVIEPTESEEKAEEE